MAAALLLTAALAAPPGPFAPNSAQSAVVLELPDPPALARHPLIVGVWNELAAAPGIADALDRPDSERLFAPLRFVADRTGRDVPTLLSDLTTGGVRFESAGIDGGPSALSITAASPEVWAEVLPAVRVWLARAAGPLAAAGAVPPDLADGAEWGTEELRYRLDGPTLRLAAAGADFAPAAGHDEGRLLSLRFDPAALRAAGAFPPNLAPPWSDPNLAAYLGGYAAALDGAGTISLTLSDSREESNVSRGLSAILALSGETPAVPGFFAPPGAGAPGPLPIAGAIYSAAWFRDYGALWQARRDLLTGDAADVLDAKDDEVRQGVKVLGADVLPSELFSQFGTSWRLVVVGGLPREYAVDPAPELPAVAVAVSLKDPERFAELADPLLRGVRLVAAFGGAKMQPFRDAADEPGGPDLSGLRFADGPGAAATGDLARFNAAPVWAVHRGHFVAASTRPLARAVLAALDEEAAAPNPLPPGTTEEQRFAPAAFADALRAAGDAVRAGLTFDAGFPPAEADRLLAAVEAALRTLGPVTVATRTGGGLSVTAEFKPAGPAE